MKSLAREVLSIAALLLVAVTIVVLLFLWYGVQDSRCEEKGGVYLRKEAKCVRGIEEIK
jgi:hypothetical protein